VLDAAPAQRRMPYELQLRQLQALAAPSAKDLCWRDGLRPRA
jgi:hypothetical protein